MATYGTSNKYINYSVNSQELSYDINSNTSVVRVWIDVWRTNTGYTTYGSGNVYARINGVVYSAGITSSQRITSTPIRLGTWDITVEHSDDGSKTINISGWISHSQFNSSEQGGPYALTTIPRASAAEIDYSGLIGDTLTVNISRKSTSFTYTLYHDFLAGSWTQFASNVTTSGSFTTPLSWLNLMPNSTTAGGRILVRTYNGGNIVGDKIYNFNASAKANVVPAFTSVTAAPVNPFGSLYLQGRSSVKLTINGATGIYGSTIRNYSIKGGNFSYSDTLNTYTTGVLNKSGSITFTATITDSRERTISKTVTINVTAYTYPKLSINAYRSTSTGVKDMVNGTYITIKPTFSFCNIAGNSIASKSIRINNTIKSTSFSNAGTYTFGTYALNDEHTIMVSVKDSVGNTAMAQSTITIGKMPLQIPLHKNGMGIGRFCNVEGQCQVGYDLNLFGKSLVNGIEQPYFSKEDDYYVPSVQIKKKGIYFCHSSQEQWTGEYLEILGVKIKIYTKTFYGDGNDKSSANIDIPIGIEAPTEAWIDWQNTYMFIYSDGRSVGAAVPAVGNSTAMSSYQAEIYYNLRNNTIHVGTGSNVQLNRYRITLRYLRFNSELKSLAE